MSNADTKIPNTTTQKSTLSVMHVASKGRFCLNNKNASVVILHIPSTPGSIPADAGYVTNRSSTKKEEVIIMASNRLIDKLVANVKTEVLEQVKDLLVKEMTDLLVEDVMRDFRDPVIRSDVAEKISYKAMARLSLDNIADAVADHYITHDFSEDDITDKVCEQLSESGWFGDEAEDAVINCVRDGLDTQSMVDRIAKRVSDMVDLHDVEKDIVKTMVDELKQDLVE